MLRKFFASLGVIAVMTTSAPMTIAADGDVTISLSSSTYNIFSGNLTVTYLSKAGDLEISIKDNGGAVVVTLLDTTIAADMISPATVVWDGDGDEYLVNGSYTVEATLTGANADTDVENLTLASTVPLAALTFNNPTFDPYEDDDRLVASYSTSPATADSLDLSIENQYGEEVFADTDTTPGVTGSFSEWNGEDDGDFVEPGTYTAVATAEKTGFTTGTVSTNFTVEYTNSDAPTIEIDSDVDSFDPDFDSAEITVDVGNQEADVELLIRDDNGTIVKDFGIESSDGDETLEYTWDGTDDDDDDLPLGDYQIIAIARNDYGADVSEVDVELDNDGGSVPSSNADIGGINMDSHFNPDEDDDLVIEFDVKRDLESLEIYAVRGGVESEIWSDSNVDQENNMEVEWDGTIEDDDDEYAEEGKWRIEFVSVADVTGADELVAADYVELEYNEPEIDEFYLSKTSIDPDQDEVVYIIFKINEDADVDIYAYEDGDEDDEIEEDIEVEADQWNAIEWDGGNYDEDDDVEIYIFARSQENEDVYDSAKKSIDIKEDDVSGSKSNITQDVILPPIADRGDDMEITYNLEDDDEVTVTIYEGASASGDKVITLINKKDQDSGDHTVEWDGKDDDGDSLSKSKEVYSYKISGDDTERGVFIITEDVGEVDNGGSGDNDDDDGDDDDNGAECSGFSDVSESSKYCDAIKWANEQGIFVGYSDGTFRPYASINRMEMLKVLLEANEINLMAAENFNYGFGDVIPGGWYMPYLVTAKTLGIFGGDAGGKTARPGDSVNRAESLKLMFETLRTAGKYAVPYCNHTAYTDVPVGAWYTNYVCASDQFELFSTYGTTFSPGSFASRGEVAQALYNLNKVGL